LHIQSTWGLHPKNNYVQPNQMTDSSGGWPLRPLRATAIQYGIHEPVYFIYICLRIYEYITIHHSTHESTYIYIQLLFPKQMGGPDSVYVTKLLPAFSTNWGKREIEKA